MWAVGVATGTALVTPVSLLLGPFQTPRHEPEISSISIGQLRRQHTRYGTNGRYEGTNEGTKVIWLDLCSPSSLHQRLMMYDMKVNNYMNFIYTIYFHPVSILKRATR